MHRFKDHTLYPKPGGFSIGLQCRKEERRKGGKARKPEGRKSTKRGIKKLTGEVLTSPVMDRLIKVTGGR
jgi:hypothetical protein